jgi:hypothetical protein
MSMARSNNDLASLLLTYWHRHITRNNPPLGCGDYDVFGFHRALTFGDMCVCDLRTFDYLECMLQCLMRKKY